MIKKILSLLICLFFISQLQAQNDLILFQSGNNTEKIALHKITDKCQITSRGSKYGILFEQEIAVPFAYESITEVMPGTYKVQNKQRYGIIAIRDGKLYNNKCVGSFDIQLKQKIYNICFSQIIPCDYHELVIKSNGFYEVTRNKKQGIISPSGSIRIPAEYDKIDESANGFYWVENNGKQGIISPSGSVRIPCMYDVIKEEANGFYQVEKDGKRGIISPSGSVRVPCVYDNIREEANGYYWVMKDSRHGVISPSGSVRIPCEYSRITEQANGYYRVEKNGKCGIISPSGSIRIPCTYDAIREEPNGYYWVSRNKLQGVTSPSGSIRIPCEYDEIEETPDGFYRVTKNNKHGIISPSGSIRIPCEYDSIKERPDGFYDVKKGARTQTLSHSGSSVSANTRYEVIHYKPTPAKEQRSTIPRIVPKGYDEVVQLNDTVYMVKRNGKYGIAHQNGTLLAACRYDKLQSLQNALRLSKNTEMVILRSDKSIHSPLLYLAMKDNKLGILNEKGETILECIYDQITTNDEHSITITKGKVSKVFDISRL